MMTETVFEQIVARYIHFKREQPTWPETAPYHNEGYATASSLLHDVRELLHMLGWVEEE